LEDYGTPPQIVKQKCSTNSAVPEIKAVLLLNAAVESL